MLASQRQDRIVAEVRARGAVRVADLVELLDVSEMTVRRDITELDRAGLVRRVHGGAITPETLARPTDEPGFEAKRAWATAEKEEIAALATQEIEPGQAIALSAGTTTHLLAQRIAADPALRPLTVVTNSLPVAETLHRAGFEGASVPVDVILTGGTRTPSDALVGPVADAALATLRVDRLYLGVHGLDPSGLMTPNLAEAATDRALALGAAAVTVLTDHSKWGVVGLAHILPLDAVDTVISDDDLPPDARRALADAGCLLRTPAAPTGSAAPQTPTDPSRITPAPTKEH